MQMSERALRRRDNEASSCVSTSPSFSLYRIVVLPAASRPTLPNAKNRPGTKKYSGSAHHLERGHGKRQQHEHGQKWCE